MQISDNIIKFKPINRKEYLFTQINLDEDNITIQGWNKINNEWYYLQNDGVLAVSTIVDGYTVGEDGKLI